MKRSLLLWAAAGVVVVSNLWVVWSAHLNQRLATGGTLDLTEHELFLLPRPGESTVNLLELRWRTAGGDRRNSPAWLDQPKLAALGFDCQVPIADARARDHYRRLTDRPAWLVLTLVEPIGGVGDDARDPPTRLTVVDAASEPTMLRERYPDFRRHAITRGLVRLAYVDRNTGTGETGPWPRLQGRIVSLLPEQLFVPRSHSALLDGLSSQVDAAEGRASGVPRYAATVSWGARYTPWVEDLRPYPGAR